MGRYSRAGRCKRMTQRNCATLSIQLVSRNLQLALDSTRLWSKSLVDFDQVHVVDGHSCVGQCFLRSGNRSDSHDLRIDARNSPRYKSAEGLQSTLLGEFCAGKNERARTIANSGCITRSDDAV